jgi:hypothetical protein
MDGTGVDDEGDWVRLARDLTPTEAHLLAACLQAAGIPADAGDTNMAQMHSLLSIAMGGASVRVPETRLGEARGVLEAFRRGDFALDEDFDVGDSPP